MFEEIDYQYDSANSSTPTVQPTVQKSDKNIVLTVPLLTQLLNWSKETDENGIAKTVEKIIGFSDGVNPLGADCYDVIVHDVCGDIAVENDIETAYNLGQDMANNGMELTPQEQGDYSDIPGNMITAIKNNGYGASNSEIEAFWDGYEGDDNGNTVITLHDPEAEETTSEEVLSTDIEDQIKQIVNSCTEQGN